MRSRGCVNRDARRAEAAERGMAAAAVTSEGGAGGDDVFMGAPR